MTDQSLHDDVQRITRPVAVDMVVLLKLLIERHAEVLMAMKERGGRKTEVATVIVQGDMPELYPGHTFRLALSLDPKEIKPEDDDIQIHDSFDKG